MTSKEDEPVSAKTVFRSLRKPTSRFKARRAEYCDIAPLQKLSQDAWNDARFGHQRLDQLIEHSLASVTIIEQTKRFKRVCGFAAFSDIPTHILNGVHNWPGVLQSGFPYQYFSYGNSVFLNAFLSDSRNYKLILEEALKVLFSMNPELDYCLALSLGAEPDCIYAKFFPAWVVLTDESGTVCLSVCKKDYLYPKVHIREAMPADVPAVLKYFETLHGKLRSKLGDNWLDKVVRATPMSNTTKCFVVQDRRDNIRGFFGITSSNIDWEFFDNHHQTEIFHRFCKVTDFDRIGGRFSNCDIDVGTRDMEEDLIYGPRMSVDSFGHLNTEAPRRKSAKLVEDDLTPSNERFITELVEELYRVTLEIDEKPEEHHDEVSGQADQKQTKRSSSADKPARDRLVKSTRSVDDMGKSTEDEGDRLSLDNLDESERIRLPRRMLDEKRGTALSAEDIVQDILKGVQSDMSQQKNKTTIGVAKDFTEDILEEAEIRAADSDDSPSSVLRVFAEARQILRSLFEELGIEKSDTALEAPGHLTDSQMEALLTKSSASVARIHIPVIGPSESVMDFDEPRHKDSLDIMEYAARIVDSLVDLAETLQSRTSVEQSTNITDSIKSLVSLLEQQGVEMLEARESVISAADFSLLAEAAAEAVEELLQDLKNAASVEKDIDLEPDESDEYGPVLSKRTLTTLEKLIDRLEKEAKYLLLEEEGFDLELRPKKFRLSQTPYEFVIDASQLAQGQFQMQKTNIENLAPAAARYKRRMSDSESNLAGPPATTARLSELAGGVKDIIGSMNFGIKKPNIPIYDSELNLDADPEAQEEGIPVVRRDAEKPKNLDAEDEALERGLKAEYGIVDRASEPMFSSLDDLTNVPQPYIATGRQEPGIRHLQRQCDKFFQNPVLGRSREFRYLASHGEQNAMYMFLFHLDPLFSTHLEDILAHCCHALPGYDYILTQLSTSDQSDPLLRKFVRIPQRAGHFLREELYFFHIAALIRCDDIEFTAGSPRDTEAIREFLDGKADSHILLKAFNDAVHYHTSMDVVKLSCTVFRVDGAIIGFAIYAPETDIDYLVAQYAVDEYLHVPLHNDLGFMRIVHFMINPVFLRFNGFVLKELLRLSGATTLFYKFYPLEVQVQRKDTLASCLDELNLVRPRSSLIYSEKGNWKLLPPSLARDVQEPFALYLANRRMLSEPKQPVLNRIVVVGASDMSLQVIRHLILSRQSRFVNLILVSPHGIPSIFQDEDILRHFPMARNLFTRRDMNQLSIPANVQLIFGRAVTLDKANKILHVNDKLRIPVDFMVIGTGMQYLNFDVSVNAQWLTTFTESVCESACKLSKLPPRKFQLPCSLLSNYFVVNDAYEAEVALSKIESIRENEGSSGYYVVYGATLEAYGCITTLLAMGIRCDEIMFVDPSPDYPDSRTVLSHPQMETWVKNLMFLNGIVVIMQWQAVSYNEENGGDTIRTVTFWTDEGTLKTYSIRAFFNYTERQIHPDAYSFVNSSYLMMDKKLVIDHRFSATAPWIFAGGSWCKYPRKLYVGSFDFNMVNSKEIGDIIARLLLEKLESGSNQKTSSQTFPSPSSVLPDFRKSVVDYIELPFGWFYCNIRSPAKAIAGTSAAAFRNVESRSFRKDDQRRVLTTGNVVDGNLFQIYLDELNAIDQIVCLSQLPVNVAQLLIMHGMQESWLELVTRYDDGYIKDFFAYVDELWLCCVFYDRFPALCGELRKIMLGDQGDGQSPTILDMINRCFRNQEPARLPSNSYCDEIIRRIRAMGIENDLCTTIGNFIECCGRDLPMYAPGNCDVGLS